MAFDGNGNWISEFSAQSDRDNNIKILASRFDNDHIFDLQVSFQTCLTKDMQIKPAQPFDFNSFRAINLATGTSDTDAVNKGQLDDEIEDILESTSDLNLNNLTDNGYGKLMMNTFCANSGNQEANGYADLVSYTGGDVSFKVDDGATYKPLICTFTDGETKTLTSIDSIDMSALANGTYTFFVNKTGETLAKLTESVFIKDSQPATTSGNVWLDTSKTPYKSYLANGSNFDTAFDYVQLPVAVVLESGAVSSVVNGRYNDRTREILADFLSPDWSRAVDFTTGYIAPTAGFVKVAKEDASQNTDMTVYINGWPGFYQSNGDYTSFCVTFPVSKGDVITYAGSTTSRIYTPLKGV